MNQNTQRTLKVQKFMGEWAIIAYPVGASQDDNNGLVWLRGFDTEVQASVVAMQLTEAMQIREVR